ncbi:MAG: hypothetical protein ACO1N0_16755 [Fluviicola sp.]
MAKGQSTAGANKGILRTKSARPVGAHNICASVGKAEKLWQKDKAPQVPIKVF